MTTIIRHVCFCVCNDRSSKAITRGRRFYFTILSDVYPKGFGRFTYQCIWQQISIMPCWQRACGDICYDTIRNNLSAHFLQILDDVIKWKHFPRYWSIVTRPSQIMQIMAHCAGNSPVTGDVELWYFLWSAPEPTAEQTQETPVILEAIALIMTLL